MLNRDTEAIHRIVHESLRKTNNRGVVLSGWSDLQTDSSRDILYLDAVPHQWLLPRCKLMIHHGGAGTTSAALRAGIPNIVVPHMADQPFWGSRVYKVGAGPKPISIRNLSEKNLSRAILDSEHEDIRKRSDTIGQQLRSERGVMNTIEVIEKYFRDFYRQEIR